MKIDNMNRRLIVCAVLAVVGCVAASAQIKITHGPWLTDMGETGVTIMWKTDKPALSWVEYAENPDVSFNAEDLPRVYDARDGRRRTLDTLHCVRLEGLKPGTEYFYRLYSKEVVKYIEYGHTVYGDTATTSADIQVPTQLPTRFKTFDSSTDKVRFLVFNDIHENVDMLLEMCGKVDFSKIDFVLLNGDMLSTVEEESQVFDKFIDPCVKAFASSVPIVYTRGNHETRGAWSENLYRFFPTSTGKFYYSFNVGKINFIVLDCGEDKPDDNVEYSGIAEYDAYREKEAAWLKAELAADTEEHSARIVALHVPPMGDDWHVNMHLQEFFLPVLNGNGVNLMISGHNHAHNLIGPNDKMDFPNLVNDNESMVLVDVSGDKIKVRISGLTNKKFSF